VIKTIASGARSVLVPFSDPRPSHYLRSPGERPSTRPLYKTAVGKPRARQTSAPTVEIGRAILDLRVALGWTQEELARRAGLSQAWVSVIERGRPPVLRVETADRLLAAMGARLRWTVDAPFLADRRGQHDAGHARCVAFAVRRLRDAGWQIATEVEIGGDRSRGWIDILAHHPASHTLLVIEVKTELHDLGAIERTLGWYEREAWASARRLGWRPRTSAGVLLLLATRAMDERVTLNRRAIDHGFPGRAGALRAVVEGRVVEGAGRYVAMIDPMSRRADWLRPLRIDGRRSEAPHADYADFVRARHARSRAHGRVDDRGTATSSARSGPGASGRAIRSGGDRHHRAE
jgi:transcriptional regulator with XRE-family HTH domain